jgi:predicted amidophosphoribosyltransferase
MSDLACPYCERRFAFQGNYFCDRCASQFNLDDFVVITMIAFGVPTFAVAVSIVISGLLWPFVR